MSNTLCIANEGNEADSCFKTKENGFVLSSLGYNNNKLAGKKDSCFKKKNTGLCVKVTF